MAKRSMIEKRIRMKNGRDAVVRPFRFEDAAAMHACHVEVVRAGQGVTRELSECLKSPEEVEKEAREHIEMMEKGAGCLLVADVDGEIAGSGAIRRQPRARIRHVGHIGIGIRPAYQELGLGRAIMEGLIAWARSLPGRAVTRVDLYVISDNVRAIRLYESLGFHLEGRRRNAIRYEDGREVDDLMMGMLLSERSRSVASDDPHILPERIAAGDGLPQHPSPDDDRSHGDEHRGEDQPPQDQYSSRAEKQQQNQD